MRGFLVPTVLDYVGGRFGADEGRDGIGAPPQVAKQEDSTLNLDDGRTRRKNSPGDQSMRRSIQDLVSSIDPNVKIEPEVEDVRIAA